MMCLHSITRKNRRAVGAPRCVAPTALYILSISDPALTRWANFATRLRRWGGVPMCGVLRPALEEDTHTRWCSRFANIEQKGGRPAHRTDHSNRGLLFACLPDVLRLLSCLRPGLYFVQRDAGRDFRASFCSAQVFQVAVLPESCKEFWPVVISLSTRN